MRAAVSCSGVSEAQPLVGIQRRELLEQRPLAGGVGIDAVDRVDLEQSVVLLVVLGLAHLPGDLVAAAQAEPPDLAERHVDVVVALHEAVRAQKAEAVGQHVQDAGLVDGRRFGPALARLAALAALAALRRPRHRHGDRGRGGRDRGRVLRAAAAEPGGSAGRPGCSGSGRAPRWSPLPATPRRRAPSGDRRSLVRRGATPRGASYRRTAPRPWRPSRRPGHRWRRCRRRRLLGSRPLTAAACELPAPSRC